MEKRLRIKELVVEQLEEYTWNKKIEGSMTLLKDLELLSDDISEAIMLLEKKTKAKVPRKAWNKASTVDDLIDILLTHSP